MKALRQMIECVRAQPQKSWALATLVETEGSTYRQPGARLLADNAGETCIGVLSGGCLEEEIAAQAPAVIGGDPSRLLTFDTRRLYGCDGVLRILLERMAPLAAGGNLIGALGDAYDQRRPCRIATVFQGENLGSRVLREGELFLQQRGAFVHEVPLPVRVLLFGAGPEIEPLRQLASTLGWITDIYRHPDEMPLEFRPDSQTAALVMTHNFGRDLAALDRLLPLNLPYVGLLGPRRRQQKLLAQLSDLGRLDPTALGTFHSPAGLDIGSEAPEEIALSIVSEICGALAGREGGELRNRAADAHLAQRPGQEVA